MSALVVICHGVASKAANMDSLKMALMQKCKPLQMRAHSHDAEWRASVLLEGIRLARWICSNAKEHSSIVLIGHSQGGLVCRVAVAALCCKRQLYDAVAGVRYAEDAYRFGALDALRALEHSTDFESIEARVKGIITLATPNSGVFTFGQLSMTGKVIQAGVRLLGSAVGINNLTDLTTDRLFRILQHVHVPRVRYLSISGSSVNRFSLLSHQDLSQLPLVWRLGLHLELPNDTVVEDFSADIRNAVLPPEIVDIAAQYEHIRWYRDCSKVNHT